MKTNSNLLMRSRIAWFTQKRIIKSLFVSTLMLTSVQASMLAQEVQFTRPSWWFGVAGGVNINMYHGTTQQLNSNLFLPASFKRGNGIGLFAAPLIEYHQPNTILGGMLQVAYDNRSGKFDGIIDPSCNCQEDLEANLSYISIEPSLRIAPFKNDFYVYVGPRVAFNVEKSFNFQQGPDRDNPLDNDNSETKSDFSNVRKTLVSMQVGAGYDIQLSSQSHQTQFVLSPFVSYHPEFGQKPRSIERLNINTLRAGIALKFGMGKMIPRPAEAGIVSAVVEPKVNLLINTPPNIPVKLRSQDAFPVRNYIFFDLGSTEIPGRYVMLTKDQAPTFKVENLDTIQSNQIDRSTREMIVYHNILNILGARMVKYPATTITLAGSSEKGPSQGRLMAESVKHYLVDVFGIDASRIKVEGLKEPKMPSMRPEDKIDLDMLHADDRRVSIESSSPDLLTEFISSSDESMNPTMATNTKAEPIEGNVTFDASGANEKVSSWSLELMDENGKVQYYGPYTQEKVNIPSKTILGTRPEGNFKVTLIAQTISGKTTRQESNVHVVLWTPPVPDKMTRFSVLYEFDKYNTTPMYEKYLTDFVTPKIPNGATVILNGHADVIGAEAHNKTLSMDRANDAKSILEKSLLKAGTTGIKFETYGTGDNQALSPFKNTLPEERFYNRTVIIEVNK